MYWRHIALYIQYTQNQTWYRLQIRATFSSHKFYLLEICVSDLFHSLVYCYTLLQHISQAFWEIKCKMITFEDLFRDHACVPLFTSNHNEALCIKNWDHIPTMRLQPYEAKTVSFNLQNFIWNSNRIISRRWKQFFRGKVIFWCNNWSKYSFSKRVCDMTSLNFPPYFSSRVLH